MRAPTGPDRTAEPRPRRGRAIVRGYLVGATIAALAIAAHGISGGGHPDSTGLTLLVSVASGIGALAATLPAHTQRARRAAHFVALVGGQWVGHEALTALTGHHHETARAALPFASRLPFPAMPAAHALAALLCALLIAAAERLYSVVAQACHAALDRPGAPASPTGALPRSITFSHPYRLLPDGRLGPRAPPLPV